MSNSAQAHPDYSEMKFPVTDEIRVVYNADVEVEGEIEVISY